MGNAHSRNGVSSGAEVGHFKVPSSGAKAKERSSYQGQKKQTLIKLSKGELFKGYEETHRIDKNLDNLARKGTGTSRIWVAGQGALWYCFIAGTV